MKPQEAGRASPAIYRCVTTSVHGRCAAPTVIAKQRIEGYVIEQFLAAFEEIAFTASENSEDTEERRRLIAEAAEAERSYRAALVNTPLRAKIGDTDHDQMVAALHDAWKATIAELDMLEPAAGSPQMPEGVTLRHLVEHLRADGKNEELRSLLGDGLEAVFVRPAASRRRNEPVADRVRVVFRGSERLALPHRGRRFEPRPYVW